MLLSRLPSDCRKSRGLTGRLGCESRISASSSGSLTLAHSLIGAAAGDASSRLGSSRMTSGAAARRCSRWWRASRTGPSGLSRSSECLSSSPRKAIFGTLRSQEELDRFARMTNSAVHPKASDGVRTLTPLVAFEPPCWMLDDWISEVNSSTHSGPDLGGSCPMLFCIALRARWSLTTAWTTAAGEAPSPSHISIADSRSTSPNVASSHSSPADVGSLSGRIFPV